MRSLRQLIEEIQSFQDNPAPTVERWDASRLTPDADHVYSWRHNSSGEGTEWRPDHERERHIGDLERYCADARRHVLYAAHEQKALWMTFATFIDALHHEAPDALNTRAFRNLQQRLGDAAFKMNWNEYVEPYDVNRDDRAAGTPGTLYSEVG